jgi:hypothetical protein
MTEKTPEVSLDQATGYWTNPAATVQFNRWLEDHFMNGTGAGRLNGKLAVRA